MLGLPAQRGYVWGLGGCWEEPWEEATAKLTVQLLYRYWNKLPWEGLEELQERDVSRRKRRRKGMEG